MKVSIAGLLLLLLSACGDAPAPPTSLEAHRGNWVVINYWAQWCQPCIREIPELNELDHRHSDISVLGVNFDGATGEYLAGQIEKLGVKFPTLGTDPSAELGVPRPEVLPTTYILDPSGELRHTLLGPQTLASLEAVTERQAR